MFNRLSNLSNRTVLGILIAIALLSTLVSSVLRGGLDTNWWADVFQGLVTEMGGAAATFWLINLIFEGRRKREEKEETIAEKKAALIRQMGSTINEEAIRAVEELRHHIWLEDGSLKNAMFIGANLEKANLARAQLQNADLRGANLKRAGLSMVNLEGSKLHSADLQFAQLQWANLKRLDLRQVNLDDTDFSNANLEGTDLSRDANLTFEFPALSHGRRGMNMFSANLHQANMSGANLERVILYRARADKSNFAFSYLANGNLNSISLSNADLSYTNLKAADLNLADLQNADLETAEFNDSTILPDDTHWTPETDLSRFTDPDHPQFWRSDNPASPAYRGKGRK